MIDHRESKHGGQRHQQAHPCPAAIGVPARGSIFGFEFFWKAESQEPGVRGMRHRRHAVIGGLVTHGGDVARASRSAVPRSAVRRVLQRLDASSPHLVCVPTCSRLLRDNRRELFVRRLRRTREGDESVDSGFHDSEALRVFVVVLAGMSLTSERGF